MENRKNASEMKGAPQKRGKRESPDVGREEGVGGLAFSEPFQASGRVVRACGERELFSVTKVDLWGEQETQPQPSPTAQTPSRHTNSNFAFISRLQRSTNVPTAPVLHSLARFLRATG